MSEYDLRNIREEEYERLNQEFEWEIPTKVNIADHICDRWADKRDRIALHWEDPDGAAESYTYHALSQKSDRWASALRNRGVDQGDIIGIFLPNCPEKMLTTLAGHKLGAINMPIYHLFGPDGIAYRLRVAEPDYIITDAKGLEKLEDIPADLVPSDIIVTSRDGREAVKSSLPFEFFEDAIQQSDKGFSKVETNADDPAQLFFTSGTTGDPKGVLHAHRYVIALNHICRYTRDYSEDDLIWSYGDTSWVGGFANLLGAWANGATMFKYSGRFVPERALTFLEKYNVDIFMAAPTALRALMDVKPDEIASYDIDLRVVFTGSERVTPDILEWAEDTFDAFSTQAWGQTECYGVGWPPLGEDRTEKLGSIGRPIPGIELAVLNQDGEHLPPGELGELAISREDNPSMFIGYYDSAQEDSTGKWHRTGDMVYKDEDGSLWFKGRDDDVIISSGYRLSPTEIESSLNSHRAVKDAAAIGVPDEQRTNIVRAYVELASDYEPSEELKDEMREHVKTELAKFQYPREIHFVKTLPKTVTGKIKRKQLRESSLDDRS